MSGLCLQSNVKQVTVEKGILTASVRFVFKMNGKLSGFTARQTDVQTIAALEYRRSIQPMRT